MASSSSSMIFAISAIFFALSFSSVQSLTCKSQKLPHNKKVFANCMDLPTLGATLHFSYNATNTTLSIAYVATPANSGGWVSWAINPTGEGMLGAQAIIAFKSNDTVVAKTYSLNSYFTIEESKLSFKVWDLSAVEYGGAITIFTSLKVPGNPDKLNQVWQVGSSVTKGMPDTHELTAANLGSKSTLSVSTTTVIPQSDEYFPNAAPSPSLRPTPNPILNRNSIALAIGLGVVGGLVLVCGVVLFLWKKKQKLEVGESPDNMSEKILIR